MNDVDAEKFIDRNILFWRHILVDQEASAAHVGVETTVAAKLGKMRDRLLPITGGRFVITDYEMDRLFQYCAEEKTNPVVKFRLADMINNGSLDAMSPQDRSNAIQELVDRDHPEGFRVYLLRQRKEKRIPQVFYPMPRFMYYWWLRKIIWTIRKTPFEGQVSAQEAQMLELAKRFWRLSFREWLLYNGILITLVGIITPAMGVPWWAMIFCLFPFVLNILLSFFSIVHSNMAALSDIIKDEQHLVTAQNCSSALSTMKGILNSNPEFAFIWRSFVRHLHHHSFRGPLISGAEEAKLLNLSAIPDGSLSSVVPGLEWARRSIIDFVNFYNMKKPQLTEILPIVHHINATGADTWRVRFDILDNLNRSKGEKVTLWSMLMKTHRDDFALLVEDLRIRAAGITSLQPSGIRRTSGSLRGVDTSTAADALDSLAGLCSGLPREQIQKEIEDWANWRLGTLWKTFESVRSATVWSYAMAGHRLGVLQQGAGEADKDYEDRLSDWAKRQFTVILKFNPTIAEPFFAEMRVRPEEREHSWVGLAGGREVKRHDEADAKFWDKLQSGQQHIWPYVLCVGSPFFWGNNDRRYAGLAWKITNYQYCLSYVRVRDDAAPLHSRPAKYLFGLDTGQRIEPEDFMYLPDNLLRFRLNPHLGLLGSTYQIFEYQYNLEAGLFGVSEFVFNSTIRRARSRVDTEPGVGKMILDVDKVREVGGMQGHSIIEDTETSNLLKVGGYDTEHTDSVVTKQNSYNTIYDSFPFITRFGAPCSQDTPLSPAFWEFWQSRLVHPTEKIGLLFGFAHYIKKQIVQLTNEAMVLLTVLLPFSIYKEFVLYWVFIYLGLVAAQAINLNAVQWFTQRYGNLRGMIYFLFGFTFLYFYYVSFIPEHSNQVSDAGVKGMCKMTVGTRDSNLYRKSTTELYHRFHVGIRIGTFLLFTIIFGAPFHPVGWFINIILIGIALTWVFSPFFFNPGSTAGHKLILGILGSLYGLIRAALEMLPLLAIGIPVVLLFSWLFGVTFSLEFTVILSMVIVKYGWGLVKEMLLFFGYLKQEDFLWEPDNFLKGYQAFADFLSHRLFLAVHQPLSAIGNALGFTMPTRDLARDHIRRDITEYFHNNGIPSRMRQRLMRLRDSLPFSANRFFAKHGLEVAQRHSVLLANPARKAEAIAAIWDDVRIRPVRGVLLDYYGVNTDKVLGTPDWIAITTNAVYDRLRALILPLPPQDADHSEVVVFFSLHTGELRSRLAPRLNDPAQAELAKDELWEDELTVPVHGAAIRFFGGEQAAKDNLARGVATSVGLALYTPVLAHDFRTELVAGGAAQQQAAMDALWADARVEPLHQELIDRFGSEEAAKAEVYRSAKEQLKAEASVLVSIIPAMNTMDALVKEFSVRLHDPAQDDATAEALWNDQRIAPFRQALVDYYGSEAVAKIGLRDLLRDKQGQIRTEASSKATTFLTQQTPVLAKGFRVRLASDDQAQQQATENIIWADARVLPVQQALISYYGSVTEAKAGLFTHLKANLPPAPGAAGAAVQPSGVRRNRPADNQIQPSGIRTREDVSPYELGYFEYLRKRSSEIYSERMEAGCGCLLAFPIVFFFADLTYFTIIQERPGDFRYKSFFISLLAIPVGFYLFISLTIGLYALVKAHREWRESRSPNIATSLAANRTPQQGNERRRAVEHLIKNLSDEAHTDEDRVTIYINELEKKGFPLQEILLSLQQLLIRTSRTLRKTEERVAERTEEENIIITGYINDLYIRLGQQVYCDVQIDKETVASISNANLRGLIHSIVDLFSNRFDPNIPACLLSDNIITTEVEVPNPRYLAIEKSIKRVEEAIAVRK
ncbi:MAG: hypothetical protein PHW65_03480, partial [Dehalococcoidales bacterium]|nr:hypothetical protein [Dehalococcoidales bacterium]